MGTITGTITLTCPLTGETVKLHQKCIDCKYFNHFGMQSFHVYVSCDKQKSHQEEHKETWRKRKGFY